MEAQPSRRGSRMATWGMACLLALLGLLAVTVERSQAAFYDVVFCAAGSDAGNPTLGARPGGFDFGTGNNCRWAVSYPAGGNSEEFMRLSANTSSGSAGYNDEASFSWYAPPGTSIVAGGGYTRQPAQFNQGWRARFWGEDWGGGVHNIMLQGDGIQGTGEYPFITWNSTSSFHAHLWPYGGWDDYKRLVYGLWCVRQQGCSRSGFVATDVNTITIVANDKQSPSASFVDAAIIRGQWVRGYNPLSWFESDVGSGLRFSRLKVGGATLGDGTIDYEANGGCRIGRRDGNREFGKSLQPCTQGPYQRWYGLETKNIPDGERELAICIQDYSQKVNGGETCDRRTIRTDNTAPGAPPGLQVTSANPQRYLSNIAAKFSLPPSGGGSPITKIHYNVINAQGEVVVPQQTVSGTNLTELKEVVAPKAPGDYKLRVWLEDQVGWVGPASTTPIPRDTVPPAAPQNISITAPATARAADGFDVRWQNILDAGSPIDAVHYEVLKGTNQVVAPQSVSGSNPEAIPSLATPKDDGSYTLRMWLSDAEGNVGAPASVPLTYQCPRADNSAGEALSSGLGQSGADNEVVQEGTGSTLKGNLRAAGGGPAGVAPVCVFSRIITDPQRDFLGLAMTGADGSYRFPVTPGASRELIAVHRRDHRELVSRSTIQTIVHPTFKVKKKKIRNKQVARFYGEIPGPHNDRVVIVLQAKVGKGWSAFRRYRTRNDGKFVARYRFRRTFRKTKYIMRAQVRQTVGYPYLQGNSKRLTMLVLPKR